MNPNELTLEQKSFILIVDDVPRNLQVLGSILNPEGYLVTPATSGKQALKIIKKKTPDLILLDIMMPEMDGYEVCETLKRSPGTKDIPIIFLTAKTDPQDIVKGFEMGGSDYITKPFNPTELLARVRTHLEIIKVSTERKELLHVLCHDLGNLFGATASALKMIEQGYGTFEVFKESMLTSSLNGLKLIGLVRKIRAMEDCKIDLEVKPVNLKSAVDESVLMLERKFAEKRLAFVTDIDPKLTVYAERISLVNSVINNIFTNAVKFSFPDSKIIVRAWQTDDTVSLSVRDFGVGMPAALQKDIFDMTKKTSRIGTAGESGTGFGMPLMMKFIHAYGGTIEISSKEKEDAPQDHGTEIKVSFRAGTEADSVKTAYENNSITSSNEV
jgi:CheY-like chemotaxis protein/anti-sigma regulatory factor (Ser/Thr protein kinase)